MPTSAHETPLELLRLDPALPDWVQSEMTTTLGRRYHTERYNEIDARAEARGEARGEAKSVLLVLESRGVSVPDPARQQILACVDTDQLDLWLRRATTAATIEEVIRD